MSLLSSSGAGHKGCMIHLSLYMIEYSMIDIDHRSSPNVRLVATSAANRRDDNKNITSIP